MDDRLSALYVSWGSRSVILSSELFTAIVAKNGTVPKGTVEFGAGTV